MPTQEFTAAPFGAPIRPMAGSITFKGNISNQEAFISAQYYLNKKYISIKHTKIFLFI